MPTAVPRTDPLAAAEAFAEHLAAFWDTGRPGGWGWTFQLVDPLHALVAVTAIRDDGTGDDYAVLLDGLSYDDLPPGVYFVPPHDPQGPRPGGTSRWLPRIENPPFGFALHTSYGFAGGDTDQLVCFSQSRDYYISGHTPLPGEKWTPGVHTVAATLSRLHDVLSPPCYRGPAGADDS